MSLTTAHLEAAAAAKRVDLAIEAVNLVKGFGANRAVDGVSLSVRAGKPGARRARGAQGRGD
ncbi:hypothetical protein [Alicyclobacillus sendaiensis]|uniref:hypothetical protein n=1 Tax=Alicyclobacillus sendaiensis TaxID=192387 RepID=UPI0007804FCD|nr:hypothetical protein [Alicyclobacillus sendaiensis]